MRSSLCYCYDYTFAAPRSRIPLKREKKVMVVMMAARISLTGSARKTPNTGFGSRCGRMKMSGISKMILRRQASSR